MCALATVAPSSGGSAAVTALGTGNSAVNIGNGPNVVSAVGAFDMAGNYANAGPGAPNRVTANGLGVSAYNTVGQGNTVTSTGVENIASNILGNNNVVSASGSFDNIAFNIAGNNNNIAAGPNGPLAIAGAFASSNNYGPNSIVQNGTGIKIK